jgi:hypothetical protein
MLMRYLAGHTENGYCHLKITPEFLESLSGQPEQEYPVP